MKKLQIKNAVPLISLFLLALLLLVDLLRERGNLLHPFSVDILLALGVLLSASPRSEDVKDYTHHALLFATLFLLARLLSLRLSMLMMVLCEIPVLIFYYGRRVSRMMILFKEMSPLRYFEDLSHLMVHVLYIMLILLAYAAFGWTQSLLHLLVLLAVAASYGTLLVFRLKHHTPMFHAADIVKMYNRFNSSKRVTHAGGKQLSPAYSRMLYQRAEELMREKKPFLIEGFSLEDLAERLFVNKNYLSRAINAYSGKHFKLWLNTFRVLYSIDLFQENKRLKIQSLALMSGFKSVVTYIQAFRLIMGETPGAYFDRLKLEASQ